MSDLAGIRKFIREVLREGSSTFGTVPPVEWFRDRMGDEPFRMNLQGIDSLAFGYALGQSSASGRTDTPEELRETVIALLAAPDPDEMFGEDSDPDDVPAELLAFEKRYPDQDIREQAESLASAIMSQLGEEWV